MPARKVTRCGRRYGLDQIGEIDELVLCNGHAWGVRAWEVALDSEDTLAHLWKRWGEELTARWRDAFPGSRPIAGYLVGEIPPPAWAHELPALRYPVRVGGRVVIADRGWHLREEELEHLVGLGLVDDDEHDRALDRLDRPHDHLAYRPLAIRGE